MDSQNAEALNSQLDGILGENQPAIAVLLQPPSFTDVSAVKEPVKADEEYREDPSEYVEGGYHPVQLGDTFINQYYVIRKLGFGTFSTVWLCWDLHMLRLVAVKVIKSDLTENGAAEDEINMLFAVQRIGKGNNVVDLLDWFTMNGVNGTHTCAVFEVMGSSLLDRLIECETKKENIPLSDVKKITRQLLEGLDFLHTKCEVIHADIKPENILTCADEDSIIKLAREALQWPCHQKYVQLPGTIGFIAMDEMRMKLTTNGTGTSQRQSADDVGPFKIVDLGGACYTYHHFVGEIQTRSYRAVEVILGVEFDTPVDLWSVACVAFELATGDLLFDVDTADDITENRQHLEQIVQLLGDIPSNVLQSGKYSNCYFDENGKLLHNPQVQFGGVFKLLTEKYKWQRQQAQEFCEFLLPMLSLDPEERVTAAACLKKPWLKPKTCCKRTKAATRKQHPLHRYEPYRLRARN